MAAAKSWGIIISAGTGSDRAGLNEAMKYSDNIYFAQAGLALGEDKFIGYGKRFGFGEQIPFLLPAARSRLVREKMNTELQLADSSYGQGEVLVTPLQMALLYCAFTGDGSIPQPRLLLEEKPSPWKEETVDPAVAESVHRALVAAVHGVAAPSAKGAVPGIKVAGKTGTAELDSGEGNICWYLTYGPAESPELVAAVIEGDGRHGGLARGAHRAAALPQHGKGRFIYSVCKRRM